ncbi:MAG: hypothetical protein U9O98_10835 [Asgard group archaeon]|nr:hypothetical protein [Asgard group archaeon]
MKHNKRIIIFLLIIIMNNLLFSHYSMVISEEKDKTIVSLNEPIITDHTIVNIVRLNQIPEEAINTSKENLHIAYQHTSHGSQIITGMSGLPEFLEGKGAPEGLYAWNDGPQEGSLDVDDYFSSGDLGNPDRTTWETRTRTYLDDPANNDVNVVMWSWCGQVSSATEEDIETYLSLMSGLEEDYPAIAFIYMTGHVDGTGLEGNLHLRNEQIRNYCLINNKILFDFADIESYNPDGDYFGDKYVTDNCDYDSNGDGDPSNDGANWATEWQTANPGEWYECSSAHSQPLNANMKAYAAWWLFAKIAGWENETSTPPSTPPTSPTPSDTSSTIPTGNGGLIGGIIGLVITSLTGMTIIILIERRKKYLK